MKHKSTSLILLSLAMLTIATHVEAQTFVVGSPQATVRGGTSAAIDQIEGGGSGANAGTVSVKISATGDATARKHYVKIDLTGQNPNTNGPFFIRYDTAANSQAQLVQVWSLDQTWPAFINNTQTWNTAQANDTASGTSLLTSGPLTATAYGTFGSATGGNTLGRVHQLNNGPWSHMIRTDSAIYLALTSIQELGGGNGLRFVPNTVAVGFEPLTTGTPPSLGLITNNLAANGQLTVVQGFNSTATNFFTVADTETAVASLTVTNNTSSEANLSSTNVFVDGTGSTRSVYVSAPPTATPGTYTVVLSLVDGDGNRATRSFTVIVQQFNLPPVIIVGTSTNSIPPTNTLVNTDVTVPFVVSDAESPNNTLTVTASIPAYSAGILASATVNGAGPNDNLSVTITPQTGVDGVGVVRISCSDINGNTNTLGFCVMVRANSTVVFVDHFEYNGSNTKLTDDAPNLWTRRQGSAQSVFFRSGTDPASGAKVAWIRPNLGAEDMAAPLVGGPYSPSTRAVLYSKFNATFADQAAGGPGINIITNSNPGEAFFRLSQGASSTTDFLNFVVVSTNNATDPDNQFRLSVGNGTGTSATTLPVDFAKPVNLSTETGPITIVTRYDVATAKCTMWVGATSEADAHVSGTDGQSPAPAGYVGMFQTRGYGDIYIDDMTVTLKIKPLITAVAQPSGGNIDLDFNAGATDVIGDFAVERAGTASGTFANVAATITSLGGGNFRATVAAPGTEGYYKIKRNPATF